MKMKNISKIINPIVWSFFIIAFIFIISAIVWILLSDYRYYEIATVLLLVMKSSGVYSTLFAAIIATVFFQSYAAQKSEDKDIETKIKNIGHYIIAFQRENDPYYEDFVGNKIVLEVCDERDFLIQMPNLEQYTYIMTKFLTTKKASTKLKNIMAFSEDYFTLYQDEILNEYYSFCNRINYPSPLYCSTKPVNEVDDNNYIDINRYFFLFLKRENKNVIKNVWVSAITDEGVNLFINVKIEIQNHQDRFRIVLLQQTIYFNHNGKLHNLY